MKELPPENRRVSTVFERGNWLTPGDTIQAGIPSILPQLPDNPNLSRLDLANWLFEPENPLTARVTVNRLWAWIFGSGIVVTLEDFGTQGALPSHPALLDWLAVAFQNDYQWRVKPLLRDMVLSSTYRQSSEVEQKAMEIDPQNQWAGQSPPQAPVSRTDQRSGPFSQWASKRRNSRPQRNARTATWHLECTTQAPYSMAKRYRQGQI